MIVVWQESRDFPRPNLPQLLTAARFQVDAETEGGEVFRQRSREDDAPPIQVRSCSIRQR